MEKKKKRKPRRLVETREDDGGRLYYISKGKKKSMKTDEFQSQQILSDTKYQRLMDVMYKFVGSVSEIAQRVITGSGDPKYRNQYPKEKEHQVLNMLSNLSSIGFARSIADDGIIGGGSYYTLTEEGVNHYVDFLVDRIPTIYKETSLKFIKRDEETYELPSLYLLMILSSIKNIDPILMVLQTQKNKVIPAKNLFDTIIKYEVNVNQTEKKTANDEKFLQKIKDRIRKLRAQEMIKIGQDNGVMFFQLTERGMHQIKPVFQIYQRYVQSINGIPIIDVDGQNGMPELFRLTAVGLAVREKYNAIKSEKLEKVKNIEDVNSPPMPIDEDEEQKKIRFKFIDITKSKYRRILWMRFIDRLKEMPLEIKFLFGLFISIFFATVSILLGFSTTGIIFIGISALLFAIILIILLIKGMRIPVLEGDEM